MSNQPSQPNETDPKAEYRRLQQRLHGGDCSPAESVDLLRQLSALRVRILYLDEERAKVAAAAANANTAADAGRGSSKGRSVRGGRSKAKPIDRLVVRALVEGPASDGIGSFIGSLRSQFGISSTVLVSPVTGLALEWLEFQAGSFESKPISFQVLALTGNGTSQTRRCLRAAVDTIMVMVEATPAGIPTATSFVTSTIDDTKTMAKLERPAVTIFANGSDAPDAMDAEAVATALGVGSDVRVVPTAGDASGYFYGFAVATNGAIRRAQIRQDRGLDSTTKIELSALLATTDEAFEPLTTGSVRVRPPSPVARPPAEPLAARSTPAEPTAPTRPSRPTIEPPTEPRTEARTEPPTEPNIEAPADPTVDPAGATEPAPPIDADDDAGSAHPRGRRASALRRLITALRTPEDDELHGP